jgi:hypothetical protein
VRLSTLCAKTHYVKYASCEFKWRLACFQITILEACKIEPANKTTKPPVKCKIRIVDNTHDPTIRYHWPRAEYDLTDTKESFWNENMQKRVKDVFLSKELKMLYPFDDDKLIKKKCPKEKYERIQKKWCYALNAATEWFNEKCLGNMKEGDEKRNIEPAGKMKSSGTHKKLELMDPMVFIKECLIPAEEHLKALLGIGRQEDLVCGQHYIEGKLFLLIKTSKYNIYVLNLFNTLLL